MFVVVVVERAPSGECCWCSVIIALVVLVFWQPISKREESWKQAEYELLLLYANVVGSGRRLLELPASAPLACGDGASTVRDREREKERASE